MINKSPFNFLIELSNLVFFWVTGVLFFFLYRIIFILLNRFDLSETLYFNEFLKTLYMGFRFDSTVISCFIIIPLLCLYIFPFFHKEKFLPKIRIIFQNLFIIISTIICVININYYKEFKDQFNHFIFTGLFDDKKAVFKSIIYDYNLLTNTFIIIIFITLFIKFFKIYENKKSISLFFKIFNNKYHNLSIKILFFFLFIASIRGSFTEYPARRFYSSISSDTFLNKTIINPIKALYYAISDYEELNNLEDENPFGIISLSIRNKHKTFKDLLKKNVFHSSLEEKPEQIFLIIMESYDSWVLKDNYDILGVNKGLKAIEQKGISFKNFIPSANSTMNSLGAIISGVPYCGVNISKIGELRLFESSIFNQFKKLGYQTNIFFTTYSSWQNLANFSKKQGVDNVYDGTSSNASKGIWGINDVSLFNNVLDKVDSHKKSLNIILTISNHSPYEEDVFKEGFKFNLNLYKSKINYIEKLMPAKVLGHIWYSDQAIGSFVNKAEEKYEKALFAFTGDHFSRRFINNHATLKEKSTVPFILYSPSLIHINKKNNIPGSHIDITPTLIELIAPKNFAYYSFGNSLLRNENNKSGIGFNKTIQKEVLSEFSKNYGTKKQLLTNSLIGNKLGYNNKKYHDSLMSLAWHYTVKGDSLY